MTSHAVVRGCGSANPLRALKTHRRLPTLDSFWALFHYVSRRFTVFSEVGWQAPKVSV
jgi:hypothetical protein